MNSLNFLNASMLWNEVVSVYAIYLTYYFVNFLLLNNACYGAGNALGNAHAHECSNVALRSNVFMSSYQRIGF